MEIQKIGRFGLDRIFLWFWEIHFRKKIHGDRLLSS